MLSRSKGTTAPIPHVTPVAIPGPYRRLVLIVGSVLLIPSALYAHISIAGNKNYIGVLAPLDRVFDLLLVFLLFGLTFCVGRRLSRVLQLNFVSAAEEIALSVMLGTGILGMLILGCGLAGLLKPIPIVILLLILISYTGGEFSRLSECFRRGLASVSNITGRAKFLLAALACLLLLALIEAMVPPWTPDETIYHLPVMKAFIERGRIYPLYDNSLGNMPFLIQMIYGLFLMAKADIAARLFSLLLMIMTGLSVYGFCSRFLDKTTGVFSAIAFIGGAMVIEVGVTARIDVALAGMIFAATLALIIYLDTEKRGWLYVASLLAGFSIGIKLNALAWFGLLGVMLLVELFRSNHRSRTENLRDVLLFGSIMLITASPWLIKNAVWFQNPIYPFRTGEVVEFEAGRIRYFNEADERQQEEHFARVRQEAPEKVHEIEKELVGEAALRPSRHPWRVWEYYTNAGAYFLGDYRHYPNLALLLVPFYLFLPKRKWLSWLLLLSTAFFLLVTTTSWISRFLLPIYPALAIVAGYSLSVLTAKLSARASLAQGLPIYVLMACLAVPIVVSTGYIMMTNNVSFIVGRRSLTQFLERMAYHDPVLFVNDNVPAGSKIMLLGLQMGYHLNHAYLADESWDSTEWRRLLARNKSFDEISTDLKRQGITHIIFSPSLMRLAVRTGREGSGGVEYMSEATANKTQASDGSIPDYLALRNWATFDFYKATHLEPVYASPYGFTVYRVR